MEIVNKVVVKKAEESKANLIKVLNDNIYGCDILLCLFVAAVQSYRVDRCLRPFPFMHVKESHKDIDKLKEICGSLPSLTEILKTPQMCSNESIDLLHWLFCQKDQPFLKRVNYSMVDVPSKIEKSFQPYYTFEVIYPLKADQIWKQRRGHRSTFLSYHGSKLDNFYSILKVGLQQHFSTAKELLYGKGIYLTTEITVSMTYAPFSYSWKNSILGNKHSIIAVCEVIDDIEKVKCKDKNFKKRAINQESISGTIPDKYFVVTDSDMVRLKYLFVYKKNTVSEMRSWIFRNIALILVCLYFIILFAIGFFQGPTWSRLKKQFFKIFYSD